MTVSLIVQRRDFDHQVREWREANQAAGRQVEALERQAEAMLKLTEALERMQRMTRARAVGQELPVAATCSYEGRKIRRSPDGDVHDVLVKLHVVSPVLPMLIIAEVDGAVRESVLHSQSSRTSHDYNFTFPWELFPESKTAITFSLPVSEGGAATAQAVLSRPSSDASKTAEVGEWQHPLLVQEPTL